MRIVRLFGTVLVVAGIGLVAWTITVWRWQDPFTGIYTRIEQHKLGHAYAKQVSSWRGPVVGVRVAGGGSAGAAKTEVSVAGAARAYRRSLRTGDPVGRLRIPRIGLNVIVVQGTDEGSLEKGPGHYEGTALPGAGRLIYIAGHRTTYLAPFAHIDAIRLGDTIRFDVPYGSFTYRVVRHYVVAKDALWVLRNHGREILRLQACHPRFFASHRYIVDAKLLGVAAPASHS
jgi:sortase A